MLQINKIVKIYHKGYESFTAVDDISLEILKGEFVVVNGASGAGKSTLLNVIGGLVKPDTGKVLFNGSDIYNQHSFATDEYRKKHVGFMFQQFHLMPYLTVLENIKLACYTKNHLENIDNYLTKCSIFPLKNKYPDELSVGEKQRAAFVRAIIHNPDLLLADEPTGNLDPANSTVLMLLVKDFHHNGGTVLLVSHDPLAQKNASKCITISHGNII